MLVRQVSVELVFETKTGSVERWFHFHGAGRCAELSREILVGKLRVAIFQSDGHVVGHRRFKSATKREAA